MKLREYTDKYGNRGFITGAGYDITPQDCARVRAVFPDCDQHWKRYVQAVVKLKQRDQAQLQAQGYMLKRSASKPGAGWFEVTEAQAKMIRDVKERNQLRAEQAQAEYLKKQQEYDEQSRRELGMTMDEMIALPIEEVCRRIEIHRAQTQ